MRIDHVSPAPNYPTSNYLPRFPSPPPKSPTALCHDYPRTLGDWRHIPRRRPLNDNRGTERRRNIPHRPHRLRRSRICEGDFRVCSLHPNSCQGKDACSALILTFTYRRRGQDEGLEDFLVELAKDCIRACHVLNRATEGRDLDDLSGPRRKQIEDLERCVDPAQPSLLTITNDIRVIHCIQCVVSERTNSANDLRGYHTGFAEEYLITRRTEMLEMLRVFDVRGFYLTMITLSNPH